MTLLKTLGPFSTDSYRAAQNWSNGKKGKIEIKTYSSIELLFEDLHTNDLVIMPAGYTNRNSVELTSWVDFHFKYVDRLRIIDVFVLNTMCMLVLENPNFKINKAIVQSSTYQILKSCPLDYEEIEYAPSKSKALSLFYQNSYRYVVCSEDDFLQRNKNMENERIIKKAYPQMVWVVYKVYENGGI